MYLLTVIIYTACHLVSELGGELWSAVIGSCCRYHAYLMLCYYHVKCTVNMVNNLIHITWLLSIFFLPAVKRLMREARELSEASTQYYAQPLEVSIVHNFRLWCLV